MWGTAVVAAAGLTVLSGCSVFPGGETEGAETTPTRQQVVVEVVGDDVQEADVTYVVGDDSEEERGAELPWRETVTTADLSAISVIAQNTGDPGTLTCSVTVNGKIRDKVTAEGEFALVVCDQADAPAKT